MKENRQVTIILGAGASKVLGFPLQNELIPFLKKNINPQLDSSDRNLIYQIENRWGTDIESALTILEYAIENRDPNLAYNDMPEEQMHEIKHLIWRKFRQVVSTKKGNMSYKAFLKLLLETFEVCTFVSLNWDTGLESLLQDMGVEFDYGIEFDNNSLVNSFFERKERRVNLDHKVLVLKPHGSLNWLYCRQCVSLLNATEYNYYEKRSMNSLGVTNDYAVICPACGNYTETSPIIIPPSHNKRVRLGISDPISRKIRHRFRDSNTLIFVGYSFREADYDIRYLLASSLEAATSGFNTASKNLVVYDNPTTAGRIKSFVEQFNTGIDRYVNLGYLDNLSVKRLSSFLDKSIQ